MTNQLVGLIQAAIVAVFGVLSAFGVVELSDKQTGAILALYGVLAAIWLAVNTARGKPAEIRAAAKAQGVSVPAV